MRTIERLKEEGVRTVFLDLTKHGGRNLTAEQWYAALLADAGRELGLRPEFLSWWKETAELGAMQRFIEALSEVALPTIAGSLVVFVDQIDVTLSLPFSTDEFFAGIRQLYVPRATRPELSCLSFCRLGTATPADLSQDTRDSRVNDDALSVVVGYARFNGHESSCSACLTVLQWAGVNSPVG